MWRQSVGYEIQEMLGEGSQGQVFKALRRDRGAGLTQTVAIKILHSGIAVELWKREFESLAKVRSPYCVQVHGFERIRRRPALVLEFVDGVSLHALGRGFWLDEEDIREIMAQAECAVLDLYKYGVFHGDLSPQNILIDRDGHLRLLDFGMANCARNNVRLTPEFAAPERLSGSAASLAADIFSLGRIEQFLRGSTRENSPYLHSDPSLRSMRGLHSRAESKERIARKVRAFQQKRGMCARTRTQLCNFAARKPQSIFVALITGITLLLASSQGRSSDDSSPALLNLRTRGWHYFLLDGSPVGYAPLSLTVSASKRHTLEWVSATGRGVKTIEIEAGKSLTLQDRDFSH